ncbi:hypothetical protein A9Q84_10125 [Halobacteriovorax marinus]|uniref:Radical SAM core domain-containing protein n=1 Tax=Halobacteriovorax marinus TaxID=97084 RepID=A0A1Y5FCW6_9BACT|nr:hypothetical protein A9Q84_10125 [Halobacteriovorax marinus]
MSKKDLKPQTSLITESYKLAFEDYIPLNTTIEITQNCNFRCDHCYNFDRSKEMPKEIKENALSDAEILQTIKQLSDLGCLYLNLSGGEALTHPALLKFVEFAKSEHLHVRLKTNGSLLTTNMVEKLYHAGLDGLDLSLYGDNEKTYQEFTGSKLFKKSIEGLERAKEIGLDTHMSIILHRENIDQLDSMIQLAENLEIPYQASYEVTKRYDDSTGSRENELTIEQFETLLKGPHSHLFNTDNSDRALQCSCARSICGISSTGIVYPCIGAPINSGDLRKQSLKDIWENSSEFKKIRKLEEKDFMSCMECDVIEYCSRSSGSIYINTGDYTGCDQSIYEQAKSRKKFSLASSD